MFIFSSGQFVHTVDSERQKKNLAECIHIQMAGGARNFRAQQPQPFSRLFVFICANKPHPDLLGFQDYKYPP
jgi:hypothetical protein